MSSDTSQADLSAPATGPRPAPRFHYPLPMPEVSHVPSNVATEVTAWKESYGFLEDRPDSGDCGSVLAWCLGRFSTPQTPPAVLRGIGCITEWALVLDDDVLDHADARSRPGDLFRLMCRVMRVLESPGYRVTAGDHVLVRAGHDAMEQLRTACAPAHTIRLATGFRRLLTSAVHKLHLDRPGEDEYLFSRFEDFGGFVYAVLIDMCGPGPTPDEEWDSPAVQALIECVTLMCALENDVTSFHKEKAEGQPGTNFVDVLRTSRGVSFDRAVALTVETRDRLMLLFLQLRERLLTPAATPSLRYLVERLGQFVIANTEATLCARRYNPLPVRLPRLDQVIRTPAFWAPSLSTDDTSPLPYPSISWWWDHH
ncbi:terpene synthase family protein [Streptomyces sp. NPDC085927]|uniref:terpene synthase family protein n=1 Tax=Streptomyces sp. NPDC085927 TaxID=3365738 RepID=UPI0037D7B29D